MNTTTQSQCSNTKKDQKLCLVKSKYRNIISILNQSAVADSTNSVISRAKSQKGAISARAETPQINLEAAKEQSTASIINQKHQRNRNIGAPAFNLAGGVTSKDKKAISIYEEVLRQAEAKIKENPKQQTSTRPGTSSGKIAAATKGPVKENVKRSIAYNNYHHGAAAQGESAATAAKEGKGAETSRKKVNQSAVVHQMSPPLFQSKKIPPRKISPGAGARNSPRVLLTRKQSPSRNMLSEQIENICQVLECLNQQEKGRAPGACMNEDINRMLRDLLKTELRKLGKTETRGSALPNSKERKNSIAGPLVDESEKDIPKATECHVVTATSQEKTRHRTPSGDRRDQTKPAINVSINHNVGNLCYAPVFIGHARSSSKEAKVTQVSSPAEPVVQSHIKTGINIINPKPSGWSFNYLVIETTKNIQTDT